MKRTKRKRKATHVTDANVSTAILYETSRVRANYSPEYLPRARLTLRTNKSQPTCSVRSISLSLALQTPPGMWAHVVGLSCQLILLTHIQQIASGIWAQGVLVMKRIIDHLFT